MAEREAAVVDETLVAWLAFIAFGLGCGVGVWLAL